MRLTRRQLNSLIREVLTIADVHTDIRWAGIVVVRKFGSVWNVLCLETRDDSKHAGKYDITKGRIEEGESYFDTAVRETEEESGISIKDLSFSWGSDYTRFDNGVIYIAETSVDPVGISPNPETGQPEHLDIMWLPFSQAIDKVIGYLRDPILFVEETISP